jgi:hypothetical protein
MARPLKLQIVERARTLIADEQHWCRRHLAEDVNGVSVSPTFAGAVKRCGLGVVIAAAYELTHDLDAAHQLGHEAMRPHYGAARTSLHFHSILQMTRLSTLHNGPGGIPRAIGYLLPGAPS